MSLPDFGVPSKLSEQLMTPAKPPCQKILGVNSNGEHNTDGCQIGLGLGGNLGLIGIVVF